MIKKSDDEEKYLANPMMAVMKKSIQKTSDSASQMNHRKTLAESRKEKEEKSKEDLEEAKKNSKARMSGGDSPELIRAKFIQATIKYSLILFLATLLGYGLFKAIPRMINAAGSSIYESMQRR